MILCTFLVSVVYMLPLFNFYAVQLVHFQSFFSKKLAIKRTEKNYRKLETNVLSVEHEMRMEKDYYYFFQIRYNNRSLLAYVIEWMF